MSTRQVSAKPTRQVGRNARRSRIAGTARASHEGTARRTYDGAGLRGKTEDESGGLPSALVIRNFLKENRHLLEESRTTGFPDQTAETAERKVTDDDSEDVTEEVWNGEIVPAEEVSGRQPREDYRRSHDGIVRRSNGREQTGLSPAAAPARYSCDLGQRHARVDVAQRLLTSWHKVNPFKPFTARSPSTPYNLVPDDDSQDVTEEVGNGEILPAEEVSGRLPREDNFGSHEGEPFRCPRGKQVAVQSSVDQHRHPDAKSPLRKKVENIEMTSLESRE